VVDGRRLATNHEPLTTVFMDEKIDLSTANGAADPSAPAAEFPSEPFPCPACGQMLAPTCRVCVACKHRLDPAEIVLQQKAAATAIPAAAAEAKPEPVRYPWPLFFAVLAFSFLAGLVYATAIYLGLVKEEHAQLVMRGAPILVGLWVFFDALRHGVSRPLRWALGTMLILAVVLPWYLARRKKPQSPVPFVEAEIGPVTRFLLFALLIFILASLIFYVVKGPPPAMPQSHSPNDHQGRGTSQPRITRFHPRGDADGGSRGIGPFGVPAGARRNQTLTNAPSDAWQT
jgi:hypothetical protein